MASKGIEIEIRFQLEKEKFLEIKEKLEKIAKFEKKSHQIDEYFTPPHKNFAEPKFPFEWLSIRKRGEKSILNYKHWYPENVKLTTHCDEFEVEIKSSEQMEKIFSALGFKKLVVNEKERESYIYNDEFEIVLDNVKELGFFIEIETIKDFGSVEIAREKLFEFAQTLGIDTSNPDERGYAFLLMKKSGIIK